MLHLAKRGARQVCDEYDVAWLLVAGELRQNMGLQRLGAHAAIRPQQHIGNGHFLPFRIGHADDAAIGDIGMFEQHTFDLGGVDVLAAGNDHVLLAVMDPEITVIVARADIAGAIPAVMQRFARRSLVAPVFEEYVGAAHGDLAGCLGGKLIATVVNDHGFTAKAGQTR